MIDCRFPRILCGRGSTEKLPQLLPGRRTMLLYGKHVRQAALELAQRHHFLPCCAPSGEPEISAYEPVLAWARAEKIESVVSLGGGSVVDAGKLLSALIPGTASVKEVFYDNSLLKGKGCFFCAVPTTAGTGAEISSNAVFSDAGKQIKQSVRHADMLPDAAVVDASWTDHSPFSVTAASGWDALTHHLESLVSRRASGLSRAIAARGALTILDVLPRACADDPAARDAMAESSMTGGMVLSMAGLGAVHALAHPVGIRYHLPHGSACAVFLPAVCRINRIFWEKTAPEYLGMTCDGLIGRLEELRAELHLPGRLAPFGASEKDFDAITANCRSGSMKCNPADLDDRQVHDLLRSVL